MSILQPRRNGLSSNVLSNYEDSMHSEAILSLFVGADHVDILVAFLRMGGIKAIEAALSAHLEAGKTARFIIGSDFYITDPEALSFLFENSRRNNLCALLVDKSEYSFHPKVYAFHYGRNCKLIVGSANLTSGGIRENYEVSIVLEDKGKKIFMDIDRIITDLISNKEATSLSEGLVSEYTRRHKIFRSSVGLGETRAKRLISAPVPPFELLQARLIEMKADTTFQGYAQQRIYRAELLQKEAAALKSLLECDDMQDAFLKNYKGLIGTWTSTGNLRLARNVAQSHTKVKYLLKEIPKLLNKDRGRKETRKIMIDWLRDQIRDINGFGINAITEILHCMDPQLFAVINQNSVYGLSFGSCIRFPEKPNKVNIDGETYSAFCAEAERLIEALRLSSFSELDSLFSYIYFLE